MSQKIYSHISNKPITKDLIEFNAIHFDNDYNLPLDNLPNNIKCLYIGKNFNQSLDNLPNEVISIIFHKGSIFDKPLDFLPLGLKALHLGLFYNCPLDNLPENLEEFSVPYHFTHSMINFPKNLKRIYIPNKLPSHVWGRNWMEVEERYKDINSYYGVLY